MADYESVPAPWEGAWRLETSVPDLYVIDDANALLAQVWCDSGDLTTRQQCFRAFERAQQLRLLPAIVSAARRLMGAHLEVPEASRTPRMRQRAAELATILQLYDDPPAPPADLYPSEGEAAEGHEARMARAEADVHRTAEGINASWAALQEERGPREP